MKWSQNDTDTDVLPLTLLMSFAAVSALPMAAAGETGTTPLP